MYDKNLIPGSQEGILGFLDVYLKMPALLLHISIYVQYWIRMIDSFREISTLVHSVICSPQGLRAAF